MLASAYKKLNKIDEAEKIILKYLKTYDDSASGHVLYAHILEEKNNYKEAAKALYRAVDLEPENEGNYIYLSVALFIDNDDNLPKCIKLIEKSIEIAPDSGMNHSYLAELYLCAGRLYDAEKEAIKGLELLPEMDIIHEQYGRIQYEFGNINEAKKHIDEALRLRPNNKVNKKTGSSISYYLKNPQEYYKNRIKYLSNKAELFPEDKKVYFLLSKAYLKSGNVGSALKEFKKHLSQNEKCIDSDLEFLNLLMDNMNPRQTKAYLNELKSINLSDEDLQTFIENIFEDSNFKGKVKTNKLKSIIKYGLMLLILLAITKFLT